MISIKLVTLPETCNVCKFVLRLNKRTASKLVAMCDLLQAEESHDHTLSECKMPFRSIYRPNCAQILFFIEMGPRKAEPHFTKNSRTFRGTSRFAFACGAWILGSTYCPWTRSLATGRGRHGQDIDRLLYENARLAEDRPASTPQPSPAALHRNSVAVSVMARYAIICSIRSSDSWCQLMLPVLLILLGFQAVPL